MPILAKTLYGSRDALLTPPVECQRTISINNNVCPLLQHLISLVGNGQKMTAEDITSVMDINLNDTLKALSNPIRLDIMHWLKNPRQHFPHLEMDLEETGVSVSVIQAKAQLSQSTISSYLALLSRAQLVTSYRSGGWTYYKRNEKAVENFIQQLDAMV